MKALDLIHMVPKVEKRLSDDLSRQVYKVRMEYAIYPIIDRLWENIATLKLNWKGNNSIINLEKFFVYFLYRESYYLLS